MDLTEESDPLSAVDSFYPICLYKLANTVQWTGVDFCGAVGLCLQADMDVLDGRGDEAGYYSGHSAGEVELGC